MTDKASSSPGVGLQARDINIGRDVVGRDNISYSGQIIQIVNPSPEALRELLKIREVSTELQPGKVGGVEGSRAETRPSPPDDLARSLDQALALFDQADSARELHAGEAHLSRIELLVKKAVLLKSEADEMMFDAVRRYATRPEQGAGWLSANAQAMTQEPDEGAYYARLKEAHALLEEANRLDPTNTEVLLHMAQLLTQLTPDDPGDEQRLLYRLQQLLQSPRNDTERFQVAQATFLLAVSSEPPHAGQLRDAREMFARLGRTGWVRQCDDLLQGLALSGAAGWAPGLPPSAAFGGQPPGLPAGGWGAPAPQAPAGATQLAGRWQIQTTDAVGSMTTAEFLPNGMCQGWQQAPAIGLNVQFAGQWAFFPQNQWLQVEGLINGMYPFALGISLVGQHPGGYYGIGSDGNGYTLSRQL
ncbi:MAG: hypothetical protein HY784_15085 [Chloroflexi bacterium]|nr:hypothetical protein [Chloroflexota bacterium]